MIKPLKSVFLAKEDMFTFALYSRKAFFWKWEEIEKIELRNTFQKIDKGLRIFDITRPKLELFRRFKFPSKH